MLEPLLGSLNAERVLIFLLTRKEGYAQEMANFFGTNIYGIQKQLEKFEAGGILASKKAGRTRLYQFNPRYAMLVELKALLEKTFSFYPKEIVEELQMNRRRPRRKGKPYEIDRRDESN